MTKKLSTMLALLVLTGALFASAPALAGCGAGARTTLDPNSATPGDVDNGQIDKYEFTVPAGQTGLLAVQMFNGDIDITVCKGSNEVCVGHNLAGINDGCHFPELNQPLPSPPWSEGTYLAEWGDPLGPGTYKLNVEHCFSSEDGEFCDYTDTDPILGDPFLPGALDDAPPVQYVVALITY